MPLVDAELRRLARGYMRRERAFLRRTSPDTITRDWRLAKLWLLRELEGEEQ